MGTDTILVVGGTGMLGQPVARRLLLDGFSVRVLARNVDLAQAVLGPNVQIFAGDVDDPTTVERALDDCRGVHISLSAGSNPAELDRVEQRGTARVAEIASRRGLDRLTYLSQMLVGDDSEIPEHRAKAGAERAIRASGVPYTIFKPTYFMETLPRHVRGKLAIVMGRQPHPLHMLAADDFAALVSRSFRTPEAAGRDFFVHGPQAITIPDALRMYCSVVEPGKRVVELPLWLMHAADALVMRGKLRGTLRLMEVMQRIGERGDATETNALLGAPVTTLSQWCEQRRSQPSVGSTTS